MIRLLMILSLSASLSACVSILPDPAPAPSVYRLASSSNAVAAAANAEARTQTRLHLVIKNFEANFDQGLKSAPLAIVDYRVTYARADDRKLLGTHSVRKTVRAQSINVSSIVAAIEDANDAAMSDIVSWLEGQKANRAS